MRPFDPRLLRAAPEARRPVAVLGLIGCLQGAATIATAFALTAVVVAVVRGDSLVGPAVATGGLFAVRTLLAYLGERVAAWAGAVVSTGLRRQLLDAWLARPVEQRPERERALTLAAQGATTVEPYVAKYLPTLVAAAVVPPLAIVALVVVDWPSALVVVLTVPLLPLFAALIGATTQEDTDRRWRALSDLSGHFLDVVRGLPTLVAYGRGERQVETIRRVSDRHRVATMRTLKLAFLSSAALELLASLSVAIVAVLVGLRLTHGSMALTAGLTAILLAPEAYWPIRRVGAEFHSAADGAAALEEILGELDPTSADDPAVRPQKGADGAHMCGRNGGDAGLVVVRGLSYTYPGSTRTVLDGLDLEIGSGLTAITGPSGVGKTTLLELVAGSRTPTGGSVTAPAVHLVTQRPFLGAGSIADNLRLGNDASSDRLWEVLREVGLDGVVAALPEGLSSRLGDDGFGLSAGQRARLVLARALLSPASVVLLDEPTAHLDPQSVEDVHRLVARLAEGRTVLAVTHRPELVALADRHVHLATADDLAEATR